MRGLNTLYFHHQATQHVHRFDHYDGFFYPLDTIHHWNRLYGKSGFLQYQCVIPSNCEHSGIQELLHTIHKTHQGSFLAVLKKFGPLPSPGLLSFPRPGTTLAVDFPFRGQRTLNLLNQLDSIVREAGGAVYPAKDARMTGGDFQSFFPRWEEFLQHKDPKFSSSFWRRVMGTSCADPSTSQHSKLPEPKVQNALVSG
jgi:FAD/FMN-containing dehydrogenase